MGWFTKKVIGRGMSNKVGDLLKDYRADKIVPASSAGNLRHGFRRIILVPVIAGIILGLFYGVATVLDEHDFATIGLRPEQEYREDGYELPEVFFMLKRILWTETSPSDDELNELWKEWTGQEVLTEEYTNEQFLEKMQERREKRLEEGFRMNLPIDHLVVVCVLVGVGGAAVVYFGIWFVGIAVCHFIRWLFFGFYDAVAGVFLLLRSARKWQGRILLNLKDKLNNRPNKQL